MHECFVATKTEKKNFVNDHSKKKRTNLWQKIVDDALWMMMMMMVVFVGMKDQGGCCWHSYPSISSLAIDSGNGENSGGGGG